MDARAFRHSPQPVTTTSPQAPAYSENNVPPAPGKSAPIPPARGEPAEQVAQSLHSRGEQTRLSRWLQGYPSVITFFGSVIALVASIHFFLKTRSLSVQLADRTVRIEAQKLLLEINKQFVTNPALLAINDEHFEKLPYEKRNSPDFKLSLRAIALMKLNVFEIVFAVHPVGRERAPWETYFSDSLQKCSSLREVLDKYHDLYSDALIEAYKVITREFPAHLRCSSLDNAPPRLAPRSRWTRLAELASGRLRDRPSTH